MTAWPGYLKIVSVERGEKALDVLCTLRAWHPRLWWELWPAIEVRPFWGKPFVWLWMIGMLLWPQKSD